MIPPGSIIYMKEGLYLSAAGIIEHFNPQTGRYGVCLFRRDIYIWARAPEFVVVAIMWSKTLFRRPVQPILMRAEDEEFDVFLRIQNINSRNNSLLV
jgi:hypothetical protein